MIGLIIKMLQTNDFHGVSEEVEIAKGKYQFVRSWKQVFRNYKRWLKR